MNTQKLLRIISEILKNESTFNFQNSLNQILTYYNQNNPDLLNQTKDEIYENVKNSLVSRYVNTDFKILENLEIYGYFDIYIEQEIENILNSQSHEIVQKLTTFIQKRANLIKKITNLKQSLESLGIKENQKDIEVYQIAFSFPTKYHKLDNLQSITKDVDLFLKSISANLSEENKNYEIISVNDGCIEFFIQIAGELADKAVDFLQIVLEIQGAIELFQKTKKGYKNYLAKNKRSAEKIAEDELERSKKEFIKSFVESLKIKGDNKIDDENRVRGLFKNMVKYFEEGVSAEVRTPLLEKPREIEETDEKEVVKELKNKLELYEKKERIDQVNQKLFLLQKEGLQLNLPKSTQNN